MRASKPVGSFICSYINSGGLIREQSTCKSLIRGGGLVRVPSNKELVDETVPSNKELVDGTVPSNSTFLFSEFRPNWPFLNQNGMIFLKMFKQYMVLLS